MAKERQENIFQDIHANIEGIDLELRCLIDTEHLFHALESYLKRTLSDWDYSNIVKLQNTETAINVACLMEIHKKSITFIAIVVPSIIYPFFESNKEIMHWMKQLKIPIK